MMVDSLDHALTADGGLPRIVVVDDNQADLDLFDEAIRELGEAVACDMVTSASKGIDIIEHRLRLGWSMPRVIILDLCMPGYDGKYLLRHLGSHPQLRVVPTVVLSSSNWHKDREECLALGATQYRVKPLDWGSYLELIAFLRSFWQPTLSG